MGTERKVPRDVLTALVALVEAASAVAVADGVSVAVGVEDAATLIDAAKSGSVDGARLELPGGGFVLFRGIKTVTRTAAIDAVVSALSSALQQVQAAAIRQQVIELAVSAWSADARLLVWNALFAEHVGRGGDDLTGVAANALFGANDPLREAITDAVIGRGRYLSTQQRDRYGRDRQVEWTCSPPKNGSVAIVIGRDVTVLREGQLLSQEQAILALLLDNLPACSVFAFDETFKFIRVMGQDARRAYWDGVECLADLTNDGNDANRERFARLASDCLAGTRSEVELTRRHNAEERHFAMAFVPFLVDDRRTGLVIALDTTERDRLRARLAAQERLATTGTLASGVAHEINNPLVAICSNLTFATQQLESAGNVDKPELLECLADASVGAERIRAIVASLSALVRFDAETTALDLRATLERAALMAMHDVKPQAAIAFELGEAPAALGNEGAVSQVVASLVINAAQAFTTSNPEKNRIVLRCGETSAGEPFFEVEDNGPGVPDAIAHRIYDPFFTTKSPARKGLGLSVCHSIVSQLHGTIVHHKVDGGGARFRVTLPRVEPLRPPPVAAKIRHRVLLIDDDALVLSAMRRILAARSDVVAMHDPRAARAKLADGERFDVVVCDVTMPYIGGLQLFDTVRRTRPEQAARFVFVTGGGLDPEVNKALEGLAQPIIAKPFAVDAINQVIAEVSTRPWA